MPVYPGALTSPLCSLTPAELALTLPRHYNRPHAEKDILDGLHFARAGGRFPTSFLVGLCRHHPYPFRGMVGSLPQRLVLR